MVELIIQNAITGKAWDVSELASGITWDTSTENQPGKLTFDILKDNIVEVVNGSVVRFKFDGNNVFYGYVFKIGKSQGDAISITAYDQTRYLKNKDTYVFSGLTASQLFTKVCNDFNLKNRVATPSWYVVPQSVQDNKTLFEMIGYGIDQTLINAGNWHIIYDDFGTLVFDSYANMATMVAVGDSNGLTTYEFTTSIDEDSYNQIKLVKENKETKKREIYIVKDSKTIAQWGLLQMFETVDENANTAQITNRVNQLLKVKNRETRTLKLDSVHGDTQVRAGSGIVISIADLTDEGFGKYNYFMVTSAKHTFTNGDHRMSLEVRLTV